MSLLIGSNLKKAYGPQTVLAGAEFRIEPGEKLGVVGRNGGGKTTLMRLIEGEEIADEGTITLARGARLGYVAQRPEFAPGQTVREYVEAGMDEILRTSKELDRVNEALGSAEGDELERLIQEQGQLSERMEFLGGWDSERRVEAVLSGIGLPEPFWGREAGTLSGGEKSRTALARELVAAPDLLLLDEPTNHLDLTGIEWLEDYLRDLRSAVLIVSHDRRLLDRSVNVILELGFGTIRRYPGSFSAYLQLKAERYETEYRAWKLQQEEIRKEDSFIKKHMGSQRTAEAKGRLKRLKRIVKLERPFHDVRNPVIRMPEAERGGELVLHTENLSVGYPDNEVLSNLNLRVGRGERIGLIGPNGMGKTTLLKVLANRMQPLDGEVLWGHKSACGYYDQDTSELNDEITPFLTIRRDHPGMEDGPIRDHLAQFLFRGDGVDAIIGGLSGGERARLALARLVLQQHSWLALDEPTNHLDLAARTALEETLGQFQGAMLCVSHDRAFLDGLCTVIFEVKDGGVTRFEGNYTEYHAQVESDRAEKRTAAEAVQRAARKRDAEKRAASERSKQKSQTKKGQGKSAKGKPRAQPRNPYKIKKLETGIMDLEAELETLQAEIATEAVYRNAELMREKQFRMAEIERDLAQMNAEWEELVG